MKPGHLEQWYVSCKYTLWDNVSVVYKNLIFNLLPGFPY